jgi:cysteinyl-tRNA synthetase
MADALLGASFDIHGGGIDLAFPHHENELAQSRCAHPEGSFANIWVHNGMLNVEGDKMSKSLGNFFTVRDLLDRGIPGEVIRFVLLSTHYRQPMDWTEAKVHDATVLLTLWEKLLRDAGEAKLRVEPAAPAPEVLAALADDLNTPLAMKLLRDLASEVRAGGFRTARAIGEFTASLALMGISPDGFRSGAIRRSLDRAFVRPDQFESRVTTLLRQREEARRARDFRRADAIRDGLVAAGIQVMDRAGGATEWEIGPDFDPARLEGIAP